MVRFILHFELNTQARCHVLTWSSHATNFAIASSNPSRENCVGRTTVVTIPSNVDCFFFVFDASISFNTCGGMAL
jgi:hypothetical protein